MLKKLIVAFGLFVGLSASGCGLYFDDSSGGDTPGAPGGGSGGSGGTTPPGTTPPGYDCTADAASHREWLLDWCLPAAGAVRCRADLRAHQHRGLVPGSRRSLQRHL